MTADMLNAFVQTNIPIEQKPERIMIQIRGVLVEVLTK